MALPMRQLANALRWLVAVCLCTGTAWAGVVQKGPRTSGGWYEDGEGTPFYLATVVFDEEEDPAPAVKELAAARHRSFREGSFTHWHVAAAGPRLYQPIRTGRQLVLVAVNLDTGAHGWFGAANVNGVWRIGQDGSPLEEDKTRAKEWGPVTFRFKNPLGAGWHRQDVAYEFHAPGLGHIAGPEHHNGQSANDNPGDGSHQMRWVRVINESGRTMDVWAKWQTQREGDWVWVGPVRFAGFAKGEDSYLHFRGKRIRAGKTYLWAETPDGKTVWSTYKHRVLDVGGDYEGAMGTHTHRFTP